MAADLQWQEAFAWAESIRRREERNRWILSRIAWGSMYSPPAAAGAKNIPDPPEPPDWMLEE